MSKFDDAIAKYKEMMRDKMGMQAIDENLLRKVTKALGPSIYRADASMVSCSDKAEIDRIKQRFLIKKMGMPDSPRLDAVIQEVCEQMGMSNPRKHRAVFNYLLVKKLQLEKKFL